MSIPSCPSREQLADFVLGRGDCCETIAEHLERCPTCEAAVRDLEATPPSVIRTLRVTQHQDDYAAERECQRATALVAAFGPGESLSERAADSGEQPGRLSGCAAPGDASLPSGPFPDPEAMSANRFRILRQHAEGALGQVSVAMDEELHREVALKEIKERFADNPESRARFLLEAEITGGLEHPGIVPVYCVGSRAAGRPFYAMRFIRGQSLKDAIAEFHGGSGAARPQGSVFQSVEFRQLLGRFNAVCNAIAYAHSRGVLHRDIKPGNIMLGNYGETLVVDWGLAKVQIPDAQAHASNNTAGMPSRETATVDVPDEKQLHPEYGGEGMTRTGSVLGTLTYMSPEQAAGRLDQLGPTSDVYSLGATFYHLLTGQPPFQREADDADDVRIGDRIRRGDFPYPRRIRSDIPAPLEAICLKAMALRPESRYGTALGLVADIEHWLADEPVSAWPEPWRVRLGRWRRRHRATVTAAAITLVFTIIAAVGALLLWETAEQHRRQQIYEHFENNLGLARAEMRAGHFLSAEEILQQAYWRLDEESAPADLRPRLEGRRDRLQRLIKFYRLADDTERFTLLQDNAQALAAAEEALSVLGVFAHKEWWTHLPDEDLTPTQREHLQNEVYGQILYATGLRAIGGVTSQTAEQRRAKFRSALEILAVAEEFRPSHSGSPLNRFCRFGLLELNRLQPVPKGEPTSAVDYYFLGVIHCMMHASMQHPASRFLRALPNYVLSDLDFKTPLPTAERLLSKAALIEPQHYFTYLFLCLALEEKPREAELVASTCISLRPDYGMGYEARATALQAQLRKATDGNLMRNLCDRAMPDCNKAIELGRPTFRAFLSRGIFYGYQRQWTKAAADIGRAVELVPDSTFYRRLYASFLVRAGELENYRLACERSLEHFRQPKPDQNSLADLAIACVQGPLDGARAAEVVRIAQDAVAADPKSAHTRYGLGAAQYRLGQYDKALASLNESLRLGPDWASKPVVWPLLAMANFRLGHADEAKEWLDKASQWHAERTAGKETYFTWVVEYWWDGVEFENLLSEAKALIAPLKTESKVFGTTETKTKTKP